MAINKKKKRRKKRSPVQVEAPPDQQQQEQQKSVQYRDDFQKTLGEKIESAGAKLEGKGRLVMLVCGALALVGIVAAVFYMNSQRTTAAGETALGRAIETSSARITDVPLPAGSTEKVFKTKKERAEAAIKEFDQVIATYGGTIGAKAEYFKAIARVDIDREAGAKELAAVAAKGGEAGAMAKFALAGIRGDDGKTDEAVKLYKELLAVENPVISKATINAQLAGVYEKAGKNKEAAAIYFEMAKAAKAASKPDDTTPAAKGPSELDAETKLRELDPEKAKELDEPEETPEPEASKEG